MVADVKVVIDPKSLRSVLLGIKAFSPALAAATRKRLRAAGDDIVTAIRAELLSGGSAGRLAKGQTTGLRQGLADGTRVSILAGVARQGVNISTSPSRLGQGREAMAKAYNKETFRHPVFKTGVWAEQQGRPYFGSIIAEHRDKMRLAVEEALTEALKVMEL